MSNGQLVQFLPLVLIVLAFWFLVIRPARKKQQDLSKLQASVGTGSQVMLGSGIYGTVTSISDETLQLEVAPGTTVKVARQAVVRVVEESPTGPTDPTGQTGSTERRPDESPNVIDEK